LGISVTAAQDILDSNAGKRPTFVPLKPAADLATDKPSLPVQFPHLIHRFPLLQNTHEVSFSGSCLSDMADVLHVLLPVHLSSALIW
jgi:hypothetical protein